jgi:hypothetical protein
MLNILPSYVQESTAGGAWTEYFRGVGGNGNRVQSTTSPLLGLLNSSPTVGTGSSVVPPTAEGQLFPHALLDSTAFSDLPADTNYIRTTGDLLIRGPVTLTNIEYINIGGTLTLEGSVTMPHLIGAAVETDLIIREAAAITGNMTRSDNSYIGSSFQVGGSMTVGAALGPAPNVSFCRFYVNTTITILTDVQNANMLLGNSIYMSNERITIGNTSGNSNGTSIGTADMFPQFYTRADIRMRGWGNYNHNGIYAALETITVYNGVGNHIGLFLGSSVTDLNHISRLINLNNALNLGLIFTVTTETPEQMPNLSARLITYRQTRDMHLGSINLEGNLVGDIGYSVDNGAYGDGTTVSYHAQPATPPIPMLSFAIVEKDFTGTYDGGDNAIHNVNLIGNLEKPYGLFSVNNNSIHNLTLRNSVISGTSVSTDDFTASVGGIAGINNGTINYCIVDTVTITGDGKCRRYSRNEYRLGITIGSTVFNSSRR